MKTYITFPQYKEQLGKHLSLVGVVVLCLLACTWLAGCTATPEVRGVLRNADADYTLALRRDAYRIIRIENVRSETLTIPSYYNKVPIVSIEQGALRNCALVKEVILSDTLTNMDYLSIQECENIEKIHIGAGMTTFDRGYIYGCVKLRTLTVSEENPALFVQDNCLIGRNDRILYAAAMTDTIPTGVTAIGGSAFEFLPIETIQIPNGVTEIGIHAFSGTRLTEIALPDTVKSIGDYAFWGTRITELTVPDSVDTVGKWAFSYMTRLEKITLGAGVTELSYFCFGRDSALARIEVSAENPKYYAEENCLLEKETARVVFCGNQLTIPASARILGTGCICEDTVTQAEEVRIPTLESEAFCGSFGNVKAIYIPETVTTVEKDAIIFGVGDSHTVYCAAEEKPEGWDEDWISGFEQFVVRWGEN